MTICAHYTTISFTPTTKYLQSSKLDQAKISMERALEILGPGNGPSGDNKSLNHWNGVLKTPEGEKIMDVSCWDWHGSSTNATNPVVSVWCNKPTYLHLWIRLLEG